MSVRSFQVVLLLTFLFLLPPIQSMVYSDGSGFKDNDNGTVTDIANGLMWTRSANLAGPVSWEQALRYIDKMNRGKAENFGYTNWRLPSSDQFMTIFANLRVPDKRNPSLRAQCPFKEVPHPFVGIGCGDQYFECSEYERLSVPIPNPKCGQNHYWTSEFSDKYGIHDVYKNHTAKVSSINTAFFFAFGPTAFGSRYGGPIHGMNASYRFLLWPVRRIR